ncbi:M20 family peptidase [Sphaerotilus sp.]|uniref:M20 family peptidase n=1 Tax=Sphaerotilus sp. TaxID=2093942 RepID=UPI00286DCDA3|nr:M20 family peptidase [Sphaerotilus sp.]
MTLLKRLFLGLLAVLVLLASVLVVNMLRQGSRQAGVAPLTPLVLDAGPIAESVAVAVRARTVSGLQDPEGTVAAFSTLHQHLKVRYPRVHAALEREVVGGRSLLYTWRGSDASARPMALLAHQDVVPLAPGTEALWKHPPFSGRVQDGMVWGRGTLDDKSNLITQLEAVERLLADGFKPKRTVYLVFGHDEEMGGRDGALQIVALLKQRQVRLEFVLDEGLAVTEGVLAGVKAPLALIGLAEKGGVSLRLTAKVAPGHSSMPPPAPEASAIGMLSAALTRLDHTPVPGGIRGVAADMFATIAPELPLAQRLPMANLWLFRPVVEQLLAKGSATNAMLRTTTALTIVNAGNKANVLPGEASAVVNFRLLPGDSTASVTEHVRRVVADARIEIQVLDTPAEPSRVSASTAPAYRLVERTVREIFPDAMVAPGLVLAGTDSRHFEDIADNVYRFMPIRFKAEDLPRVHGTDERIAVAQLADMVRFYHRLLSQAATP